jgi:hypothetical protein
VPAGRRCSHIHNPQPSDPLTHNQPIHPISAGPPGLRLYFVTPISVERSQPACPSKGSPSLLPSLLPFFQLRLVKAAAPRPGPGCLTLSVKPSRVVAQSLIRAPRPCRPPTYYYIPSLVPPELTATPISYNIAVHSCTATYDLPHRTCADSFPVLFNGTSAPPILAERVLVLRRGWFVLTVGWSLKNPHRQRPSCSAWLEISRRLQPFTSSLCNNLPFFSLLLCTYIGPPTCSLFSPVRPSPVLHSIPIGIHVSPPAFYLPASPDSHRHLQLD